MNNFFFVFYVRRTYSCHVFNYIVFRTKMKHLKPSDFQRGLSVRFLGFSFGFLTRVWKLLARSYGTVLKNAFIERKKPRVKQLFTKTVFNSRSAVSVLSQWRLDYASSRYFFIPWYFVLFCIIILKVSIFVDILCEYSANFVPQRTRYHIRISITKICDRLITVKIFVWCLSFARPFGEFLSII